MGSALLLLSLLSATPGVDFFGEETLACDDGSLRTWWCSDRDSFGAAVRFTPPEYPCEVLGARAVVRYDMAANIYVRAFAANGQSGMPGTLLAEEFCDSVQRTSDSTFRDYNFTAPVVIDSGDFYLCLWQKGYFNLVFASDQAFDSVSRQLWFFPDLGWRTPWGMNVADHLLRARVRFGTGVEEELGRPAALQLELSPNPASGNRVSLRFGRRLPAGPVRIRLSDAAGRIRRTWTATGSQGRLDLKLPDLPAGAYLVELETSGCRLRRKLVLTGSPD